MQHLLLEHTHREGEMLKRIVEAWYFGKFDLASEHNTEALLIRPRDLLQLDINPFLRRMGAPEWTQQSALYEWFMKELNGLTDAEIKSTHTTLRLVRKATAEGYRSRLRALLKEDLADL